MIRQKPSSLILPPEIVTPTRWPPPATLPVRSAASAEAPLGSDKQVIAYCRTSARASVTHFTLRLIGYANVALYSAD
jgi:rhodanese-related sulfurtransferase